MGEEELKDHAPRHSPLGLDSRDGGSGHGPLGPDPTSRARRVWSVEEGDKPRVGWPEHPAEPLCTLSLGWNDAPFWPVLPERGLSPQQLGKDPALPLPRLLLPPRSASRVKGPSQDMSAGPSTWPPASSVAPVTSSCSIQFTAATVLSGGSLDFSSIQVMVTMASPTAFSTRLLQELPRKPFPRPRFGLKSLSDPT